MTLGPTDSPALALGVDSEDLQRRLQRLARGLVHDEAAAEDVVQEAWLAALRAPAHQVRDWGAWLSTVVRRLATKSRLRSRRQRETEGQSATPEMFTEDGLRERVETFRSLERAVSELADPYRAVMRMRFFEERSYAEICERLGRPKETVRSQIKRGLEMLRRRLDAEHDGNRASWAGLLLPLAQRAQPSMAVRLGAVALWLLLPGALAVAWWSLRPDPGQPETEVGALASPAADQQAEVPAPLDHEPEDPEPGTRSVVEPEDPASPEPPVESAAPAESGGMSYIDVQVLDDLGVPSPNALVGYRSSNLRTRTSEPTDEDGRVRLEIEPEVIGLVNDGITGIEVMAISQVQATTRMHSLPLSPGMTVPLEVSLRGPIHEMTLRVVDASGTPVEGAKIALLPDPRMVDRLESGLVIDDMVQRAVTDSEGRTVIERLHRGRYSIDITASGFPGAKRSVELVEVDQLIEIALERGTRITGVVRDEAGEPVRRADVWVMVPFGSKAFSTRTRRDGSFVIEGAPAGPRYLHTRARDGTGDSQAIDLDPGEEFHWEARARALEPFVVRVETDDQRPPTPGTTLGVFARFTGWDWATVETLDSEGRAALTHLPDGELILMVFPSPDDPVQGTLARAEGVRPGPDEFVLQFTPPSPHGTGTVRGDLRLPDSIHISVPWIEYISDASGPIVRTRPNPLTSSFVDHRVPVGRSGVMVCCGEAGIHFAGTLVLAEGEETDLGTLVIPEPREVDPLGGIDVGARGTLFQHVGAVDPVLVRSHSGPVLGALLPGKYRWSPSDGGTPVEFEVP